MLCIDDINKMYPFINNSWNKLYQLHVKRNV